MASDQPEAAIREREDEQLRNLQHTLDSVREDSEVANALLGLSSALAELRTIDETLQRAVRLVPEVLGADRCLVATWDPRRGRFEIAAHAGYGDDGDDLLRKLSSRPEGMPVLHEALRQRAPIMIGDAASDPRLAPVQAALSGLGAYVAIPLSRWGDDFGALAVAFSEPKDFDATDVALARGVGRQLSVALTNARRFNLLQQLREFGLRIGSQLRLEQVSRQVAAGAADLLSGSAAVLYFVEPNRDLLVAAGGAALPGGEALLELDLTAEPWAALLEDGPVPITDLRSQLDNDDVPPAAVAVAIPGTERPLLGAVVVFFDSVFSIEADEWEALKVLASQASMAVQNAQRFERQRSVARSLQHALVPSDLPEIDGFDYSAVYEPADGEGEVGGDFFDVFDLPDGKFAIVVGDVSGKGAEAAAQTAMAKFMLRAFAMRNPSPASVLFHLNNALVRGLVDDRFTTLVYITIDAPARRAHVAIAGHPSPLLYRSTSKEIEPIEAEGSLLGAFDDQQYEAQSIDFESGDILVTYTDGMLEARAGDELYGLKRLAESLGEHAPNSSTEEIVREMYRDVSSFGHITDDTVVFALACR